MAQIALTGIINDPFGQPFTGTLRLYLGYDFQCRVNKCNGSYIAVSVTAGAVNSISTVNGYSSYPAIAPLTVPIDTLVELQFVPDNAATERYICRCSGQGYRVTGNTAIGAIITSAGNVASERNSFLRSSLAACQSQLQAAQAIATAGEDLIEALGGELSERDEDLAACRDFALCQGNEIERLENQIEFLESQIDVLEELVAGYEANLFGVGRDEA